MPYRSGMANDRDSWRFPGKTLMHRRGACMRYRHGPPKIQSPILPIERQKHAYSRSFLPVYLADDGQTNGSARIPPLARCMRTSDCALTINQLGTATGEKIVIVRRRTWFYRLAGQHFAQAITFRHPITAVEV